MALNGTSALSVGPIDRDEWTHAARRFADHNYRQSWEFGVSSAERVGAVSEHVAIRHGEEVLALADVRVKRVPLLGGIAYVTGGPLTWRTGEPDAQVFAESVTALRREYGLRRGFVLRIVPPIGPPAWNDDVAGELVRQGFLPTDAARGYRTFLVPIASPLPDVRRALHQKWRNCLNRSEREGLVVTSSRDVAALERFGACFEEFVSRKGFEVPLSARFYADVQRRLPEEERMVVLACERDGEWLAGLVLSVLGSTMVYLLGATSPAAHPVKAAYLLHWRAIELAKEEGCRWYDLGGIDPEGNPGVFHFKSGFGGLDVAAGGPLEWRGGARSRLVLALESGYRALRAPAPLRRDEASASTCAAT